MSASTLADRLIGLRSLHPSYRFLSHLLPIKLGLSRQRGGSNLARHLRRADNQEKTAPCEGQALRGALATYVGVTRKKRAERGSIECKLCSIH